MRTNKGQEAKRKFKFLIMINLVVPSKIVGGSEVESRTGGRASCTLLQGE